MGQRISRARQQHDEALRKKAEMLAKHGFTACIGCDGRACAGAGLLQLNASDKPVLVCNNAPSHIIRPYRVTPEMAKSCDRQTFHKPAIRNRPASPAPQTQIAS